MNGMVVGYKLMDNAGTVYQQWGGTWGQCPGMPNPLILPNGDYVHGPSLNTDCNGYKLVEWWMDEPQQRVPDSVTPRQARLLLLAQGKLDQVEEVIRQRDRATQIAWDYATELRRSDPLLNGIAASLNMTTEQIDQFFIAAEEL